LVFKEDEVKPELFVAEM